MAANTLTRGRLRRLADVHPDRGRVLSVFMNLDPSELPTPAARSSAVTSVLTEAARRVEDAGELDHDERQALRTDVERVREVLTGDVAANGTRAVAVFACQPADLLEVVALRHPIESRVVLDDSPFVEPLVHVGAAERWCVLLANRRVARLFVGDGDELDETDRIEDDVHRRHEKGGWSQANYQRSVDKEVGDHVAHTAEVAFALYKRRGFDRLLVGAPDELVGDLEAKLHPYLRERLAGRVSCDVEHSSLDAVRGCAGERIEEHARTPRARGARPARPGRRQRRPRRRRAGRRARGGQRGAGRGAARRPRDGRGRPLRPRHGAPLRDARGGAGGRDRHARDRHRREGDREGDRAVGRRDGDPPPRRPRPARRHRRDPALLDVRRHARRSMGTMRALVVVDYQNDFAAPDGALSVSGGDAIAERINELMRSGDYDLVVATRDWHPPDHGSFTEQGGIWPVHCVQDTDGRASCTPTSTRRRST